MRKKVYFCVSMILFWGLSQLFAMEAFLHSSSSSSESERGGRQRENFCESAINNGHFDVDWAYRIIGSHDREQRGQVCRVLAHSATYLTKECLQLLRNEINNAVDGSGNTLLHVAVLMNDLEIVDLLIKNRASINRRRKDGKTPIALSIDACVSAVGSEACERVLEYFLNDVPYEQWLQNDDVVPRDSQESEQKEGELDDEEEEEGKQSKSFYGSVFETGCFDVAFAYRIINSQDREQLRQVRRVLAYPTEYLVGDGLPLLRNEINNAVDRRRGNTLLHVAVLKNDFETVDLLVKNGASINSRRKDEKTPIGLGIDAYVSAGSDIVEKACCRLVMKCFFGEVHKLWLQSNDVGPRDACDLEVTWYMDRKAFYQFHPEDPEQCAIYFDMMWLMDHKTFYQVRFDDPNLFSIYLDVMWCRDPEAFHKFHPEDPEQCAIYLDVMRRRDPEAYRQFQHPAGPEQPSSSEQPSSPEQPADPEQPSRNHTNRQKRKRVNFADQERASTEQECSKEDEGEDK